MVTHGHLVWHWTFYDLIVSSGYRNWELPRRNELVENQSSENVVMLHAEWLLG